MSSPLGWIPDWQVSADPNINPMVNPHVTMPAGWYQAGAYFSQPAYNNGYTGSMNNDGLGQAGFKCLNCPGGHGLPVAGTQLGYVMIDEGKPPVGVPWGMIREGDMVFNRNVDYLTTGNQKDNLGFSLPGFPNPFEQSWAWRNRKPLVIAGVAVTGLALLSLVSSLLR